MRKFNMARLIVWLVILVVTTVLWAAAALYGFIGSTVFIGHVSMVALVLSAGAAVEASLPNFEPKQEDE